jgi:hypothetical protein
MDARMRQQKEPEPEMHETGTVVVWTLKWHGVTSGLSEAHRYHTAGKTYCMRTMPAPDRLVPTALLSVPICKRCEVLYTKGADVAGTMRSLLDSAVRGAA